MTEKQKKFCDEYIISCNATQAAINAGYAEDSARVTGAKLLTKANIRAYIDEQLKRMHDKKIADGEEVLSYLTAVMRGEHTERFYSLSEMVCKEYPILMCLQRRGLKRRS
jgi:phage terminase small subunit